MRDSAVMFVLKPRDLASIITAQWRNSMNIVIWIAMFVSVLIVTGCSTSASPRDEALGAVYVRTPLFAGRLEDVVFQPGLLFIVPVDDKSKLWDDFPVYCRVQWFHSAAGAHHWAVSSNTLILTQSQASGAMNMLHRRGVPSEFRVCDVESARCDAVHPLDMRAPKQSVYIIAGKYIYISLPSATESGTPGLLVAVPPESSSLMTASGNVGLPIRQTFFIGTSDQRQQIMNSRGLEIIAKVKSADRW